MVRTTLFRNQCSCGGECEETSSGCDGEGCGDSVCGGGCEDEMGDGGGESGGGRDGASGVVCKDDTTGDPRPKLGVGGAPET